MTHNVIIKGEELEYFNRNSKEMRRLSLGLSRLYESYSMTHTVV